MSLLSSFAMPPSLVAWSFPIGYEWIIILALGLLFFGKRLPGAARGVGQGILEFKRGFKGRSDEEVAAAQGPQPTRFDSRTGKPLA